jgi:hypothetical protein
LAEHFAAMQPQDRIIIFCHDPSALGVLAALPDVHDRVDQVECTVVGHLHTPLLLGVTRMMRHLPVLKTDYPIARIVSHGAQNAKDWKRFNPVVCPSTYGVGTHISGGVLFIEATNGGILRVQRKRIRI